MRRSTHGAFSEIEPQMPRVCGPKPNSPFLPNPTPPPLPSRLQPPPLPPKHRSMGVTIKKYKPNAETSDSYGRDVYESISDAPISPQPKCITGHPGPYVPRDLCVHTIAPNTMRRSCVSRKPAGPPLCSGAGAFEVGYSPTFAIDPNTGIPRGPCTCNLGASAKQSSPVWSKMNPDDSASFIRTQPSSPEQTVFNSRPSKSTSGSVPNILDKKSGDSDSRPSTVARFSRTVSRFFRRKSSSRKNKSVRSCSVFFTEGDDKLIKNPSVSPPSNICPPGIPAKQSPSRYRICSPTPLRQQHSIRVPASIKSPPHPPPVSSRSSPPTGDSILCCMDHPKPVSPRLQLPDPVEVPCGSNTAATAPAVPCVHHVHHIHHVHHVHHHLHHAATSTPTPPPPPPPPRPPLAPHQPSTSTAVPVIPSEEAAAIVRILENAAATLGDTPPAHLPQLKDFKPAETQQPAAAPHTYSAYGVRAASVASGVATTPGATCCSSSLSPTPPTNATITSSTSASSQSTSNSLHRHSAVCSSSRCLSAATTAHLRHARGSPGGVLRTPCSAELAEIVEVGASTATNLLMATRRGRSRDGCISRLSSPLLESSHTEVTAASTPSPPPHNRQQQVHHLHHHEFMLHHPPHPTPPQTSGSATPVTLNNPLPFPSLPPPPAGPTLPLPSTTTTTTTPLLTQDHRSSFQESMKALRKVGWYWGPLSFTEAEKLLANRPDGTFLVRDSAHDTFFLSLSFRVGGNTYHTRIEHSLGRFSFWFEPESHSAGTVVEFIKKAVAHSIGGKYHYFLQTSTPGQQPVEVSLLYPLSRFQVVQSLKHLTRFAVLSNVRRDHISCLPVPPRLTSYLLEKQVYCESLEDFEEAIRDRPALQFTFEPTL